MDEADKKAELIEYCQKNDRICPVPTKWDELYGMLPDTRRDGNGWTPALPLILGGWHHSSDTDKRLRLGEHIKWADEHGKLDTLSVFLRTLDESEWHHLGD